ncbi:metal ABC transporter ATP-binding protein [Alkalibacter mobilis]|uniref:metal ABC transporter ATP-binding protein n=1 Tax=Alkalibacter mobilis TaxID=2787712 RepID=UPI0018A1044B|nr:ABC transporter ATP-binding protein [Alkalibacter mobilis]MBF7096406.1 ABC transporter ATP-binding protein [Alkalibacter mobilis]
MNIIDINNISVEYFGTKALEGVCLSIVDKEFLSIIGPNGGGKTTLIKTILGLVKPSSGIVEIKKGLRIGYVPQHTKFDRNFPISVHDVIITGRIKPKIRMFSRYSEEDKRLTDDIIERLGLETLKNRQIGELSGGQLQKVLIARALVTEPDLLILDEPTANLDAENKNEIYKILHKFNEDKAVILVTHDIEYLNNNKRHVVLLNKKIIYSGDSRRNNHEHYHGERT